MTETIKALLARLAEVCPTRFSCNQDEEYNGELWQFDDDKRFFTLTEHAGNEHAWLFAMMNELEFAAIWKQEGRTWEESCLNAIVHHFEKGASKNDDGIDI